MRATIAIAFVVTGCGSEAERDRIACCATTDSVEKAAQAAELATTTSLPRANWPCGGISKGGDTTWTFIYGDLDRCTLPISSQEAGIVGCPTKLVTDIVGRDGKVRTTETVFRYERGHLVDPHVTWEDGRAVAYDQLPFVLADDGVRTQTDKFIVDFKLRGGKLVEEHGHAPDIIAWAKTTLVWSGNRLASLVRTSSNFDGTATMNLTYACKS
jgi:hypothetical protein